MTYVWLLIAGGTFFAELGHPGLFLSLAISIGSLAAASCAAWDYEVGFQLTLFIVITSIAFWFLRSSITLQKFHHHSNAQALIGQKGIVTELITPNNSGRVRINSEEWRAHTIHNISLEPGSPIIVVRIERTTLVVSSIHNS